MGYEPTRREFIGGSTVAALGFWLGNESARAADPAPKEKLKVAAIGVGGKGGSDTQDLANGNICLAICDVDRGRLAGMAKSLEAKHGAVKTYTDYRKMFDEVKGLDAVTISTPDHHHGPAALMALTRGIATFVQKPMAHTVAEVRLMREWAKKNKLASQMGNQGTSTGSLREQVEIVQSGAIGAVKECHVWTNRPVWPQGLNRPTGEDPVPDSLDWDSWIGPAAMRPFKQGVYHPFKWRGFYDFGTGALGDMACHTLNMPFWGLKLGYPTSFQRVEADTIPDDTYPNWSTIRYEFPEREGLPACTLFWYDGSRFEEKEGVRRKVRNYPPKDKFPDGKIPSTGALLIGDKGVLVSSGDYADNSLLYPEADFKDYKKPKPFIPRSPGHMQEFVRACKGGDAAMSNFEYAGFLTEVVLAGCLAMRTDKKIEWDGPNMLAKGLPELDKFIDKAYRQGWDLPGRELLKKGGR